jgi:hypothetical protein
MAVFMRETVAPGITPPVESLIVPERLPPTCATATAENRGSTTSATQRASERIHTLDNEIEVIDKKHIENVSAPPLKSF